jgi:hypothetical protein
LREQAIGSSQKFLQYRRQTGFSKIRATLLLFFARPEVSRDRVDRRFVGEFFVLCLVIDGTPKMFGDPL